MLKDESMKKLWNLGYKAVEAAGFELIDMEFVKESGNWYLRYYIDKPGGITIDDCQTVSVEVGRLLDIADLIPCSYILEVSSPGLERPIKTDKDFLRYIGSFVEIKTFEKIGDKKVFTGILEDYSNNTVTVKNGECYLIPKEKISSAKLKFKWDGDRK
ncbi:Ribosome maturation factor RimP [Tepidanaerobacter acetatoxydans Re1]|uniref:Ribosome maturation factor RimP n=1 Tax=Tepidanaerobacter acetatoxydans (strain DSM 21804 / JCM 16047 / Re1) TaxID=1209989 RepID=F4LU82_TEPAE|nr:MULTISPECIES: ribosome maturation factor RimP [Tepidanaerobacter]AEE91412.1 Ribosome maturation factor rimP [Tepidanaerobacter acetatoxydans Re1]CCP26115.1 Ribosome maturation factor RimP [Tepidanaerobacter acetatoxydans Re1]